MILICLSTLIFTGSGDDVKFSVNFRDGGSDFDASKTTTYFYAHHKEDTSDPTLGYAGSHDLANGTGYQTLQYQCGTDNDQSTSVEHFFYFHLQIQLL